ncbi:MAG TPA: DUF934 domain-containing protein [Azospirillaceae bacterium]|nr:DUF934 domain-containing protein [Azospirillaceae bacterium]
MPLIENGRPVEDEFTAVADDAVLPDGPAIVSLERWRAERETLLGRNQPTGVRLKSSQLAPEIAPDLDRVALVAVEFPKFRDGRGFSTARELRERYGYTGPIRAVGHTIADQYQMLLRCGFTQVEAPADRDLSAWEAALTKVTVAYQPSVQEDRHLSLLRRHIRTGDAA